MPRTSRDVGAHTDNACGGRVMYEGVPGSHMHLRCVKCGATSRRGASPNHDGVPAKPEKK